MVCGHALSRQSLRLELHYYGILLIRSCSMFLKTCSSIKQIIFERLSWPIPTIFILIRIPAQCRENTNKNKKPCDFYCGLVSNQKKKNSPQIIVQPVCILLTRVCISLARCQHLQEIFIKVFFAYWSSFIFKLLKQNS